MFAFFSSLFYASVNKPHERDTQNQTFDAIYQTVQEAMELPVSYFDN